MTRSLSTATAALVTLLVVAPASSTRAQSLGTFSWQLQPFCNVVTVNLTQQGGVYTLDGYDDQCGAPQRAALTGLATPNPDGTIGFGLNVVTAPGGRGVQIDARITLPSASGVWTDSAGSSGTFSLGARTGGTPRPIPPAATIIPGAFALRPDGGFIAGGALGAGAIPVSGAGSRMMWYPKKAAFRAGTAEAAEWDDANTGRASIALGQGTTASGDFSTALGNGTTASAVGGTALGVSTTASGLFSTAMGVSTKATGNYGSTAMGEGTTASGNASTAMGGGTTASGYSSTAMGLSTKATGSYGSTATGWESEAYGQTSTAIGRGAISRGTFSITMGHYAETAASAYGSFVYGDASTTTVVASVSPNQFLVRAAGGTVFWSTSGTTFPTSPGVTLNPGASAWSSLSDVNSKENFRDLRDDDVLARIAAMPVREWNYKAQDAAIRHMGPTAQDFHAAFGLGEDPLRISTIDADGVALAAIKALEARTRAAADTLRSENDAMRGELRALSATVDELRALVSTLRAGGR